jgi:hypothetical protein
MQTIVQILGYPDGTPIDAVQGKITWVDPLRTTDKGTVQNVTLSDVGGNKIRATVWDHADLSDLKDKEYVLHAPKNNPRFPAIKVVHGSYVARKDTKNHKAGDTVKTVELSVNKNGVFQFIEVFKASAKPSAQSEAEVSSPARAVSSHPAGVSGSVGVPTSSIHGATVGMAINQACTYLIQSGQELDPKKVHEIASKLVRVAQHMEKGNLAPIEKPQAQEPRQEPTKPEEVADDDVPF